jgi:hypothetical protein
MDLATMAANLQEDTFKESYREALHMGTAVKPI